MLQYCNSHFGSSLASRGKQPKQTNVMQTENILAKCKHFPWCYEEVNQTQYRVSTNSSEHINHLPCRVRACRGLSSCWEGKIRILQQGPAYLDTDMDHKIVQKNGARLAPSGSKPNHGKIHQVWRGVLEMAYPKN